MSSVVCRLVEETKREGFVDVTQAYSKIINSIREAEEAAKMADKAAHDAVEVQDKLKLLQQLALTVTYLNYTC